MTSDTTVERFADIDVLGEYSLCPDGRLVAYVSAGGSAAGVWVRPIHGAKAEPTLVWAQEPVQRCVWRPDGGRLLLQTDPDGKENHQLVEVDPVTGRAGWHSRDRSARHEIGPVGRCGNQPYSPDASLLAYATNARDHAVFDVVLRNLRTGQTRTVLRGDERYFPVCFSPDGALLLIHRMRQNTDHDLFVCRVATGEVWHATPHEGLARYLPGAWSSDSRGLYLASTAGRDRAGLAYLPVTAAGQPHWLATPESEVDYVTRGGDQLLWATNVDGYTQLHLRDLHANEDHTIDVLPQGVSAEDFGRRGYAPQLSADGTTLITGLSTPRRPIELYRIQLEQPTATMITQLGSRAPDPATMIDPEIVHYPSDTLSVPALLYRPSHAHSGHPAPMVVVVHGGPEVQARPTYDPLVQYLLSRGIGIIQPNYRGSSGYGMAYQRMVYRDFRRRRPQRPARRNGLPEHPRLGGQHQDRRVRRLIRRICHPVLHKSVSHVAFLASFL